MSSGTTLRIQKYIQSVDFQQNHQGISVGKEYIFNVSAEPVRCKNESQALPCII